MFLKTKSSLAHRDACGGSRPQHHEDKSVLPEEVELWSLTTLGEKLIKIGGKAVRHSRYVTFQRDVW